MDPLKPRYLKLNIFIEYNARNTLITEFINLLNNPHQHPTSNFDSLSCLH